MRPERFGGVKIDLDGLNDPERRNLAIYTARRAAQALHEMSVLEQAGIVAPADSIPDNVVAFRQRPDHPPIVA